uniref:Uncharacterized protein n=1 Tax=Glossina brevipalpis TaxID=37001 RepID=A0A1A9X3A2_9MUSC
MKRVYKGISRKNEDINYVPKHNFPNYISQPPQAFTIILQQNAANGPEFFPRSPIYNTVPVYPQNYVHDISHNLNLETYKFINHPQHTLPIPVQVPLPEHNNLYKQTLTPLPFNTIFPRIIKVIVESKGANVGIITKNYNPKILTNYGNEGEAFITESNDEHDDYFKNGRVVENGIVTAKQDEESSRKDLEYQSTIHQPSNFYDRTATISKNQYLYH